MKNQYLILLLLITVGGCNVFRPASKSSDNLSVTQTDNPVSKTSSQAFIQDISTESSSKTIESPITDGPAPRTMISTESKDYYEQLQFKYAILINTPYEDLTNQRLLIFMDKWYGTPYHYGGTTRDG